MKEVKCTRGFGRIADPQTGKEYVVENNQTVRVSAEVAKRLKDAHAGVVVMDAEPEDYKCGVNDCSRTVESLSDTCWQH